MNNLTGTFEEARIRIAHTLRSHGVSEAKREAAIWASQTETYQLIEYRNKGKMTQVDAMLRVAARKEAHDRPDFKEAHSKWWNNMRG